MSCHRRQRRARSLLALAVLATLVTVGRAVEPTFPTLPPWYGPDRPAIVRWESDGAGRDWNSLRSLPPSSPGPVQWWRAGRPK